VHNKSLHIIIILKAKMTNFMLCLNFKAIQIPAVQRLPEVTRGKNYFARTNKGRVEQTTAIWVSSSIPVANYSVCAALARNGSRHASFVNNHCTLNVRHII